jgi:excisionase family DNA binding protein
MRTMLTYSEVRDVTGLPLGSLYSMVHHKAIPHVRLGPRLVRFPSDEIDAWLNAHRVPSVVEGKK